MTVRQRSSLRMSETGATVALLLAVLAATVGPVSAQEDVPAAAGLVARALAFHDPDGLWGSREITMSWVGTGAEGDERMSLALWFGVNASDFSMEGHYRGSTIAYRTTAEDWTATVDGEAALSQEVRERMGLIREDGFFWRGYLGFLAGLPMKIIDAGARLDPDVIETDFQGRPVQAVRVTYDPGVGHDTWYFYFDPESAQVLGCRFYHDESANDGEYITFDGLVSDESLRLPRRREWYVNKDGRYLGADEIRSVEVHDRE